MTEEVGKKVTQTRLGASQGHNVFSLEKETSAYVANIVFQALF